MTTDYDYTDAPPLDDHHAPAGVPSPDATAISIALNRIATALERLSVSPGGVPASAPAVAPASPNGAPSAPPGGQSDEIQVKRGKKIYAVCMNQSPQRDVKQVGEHVTLHAMAGNSQKWSEADQIAVLDAFKEWGWT